MSGSGGATGPRPGQTVNTVLKLVAAACVLIPIGTIAYQAFWPHTWDGDVPAVVSYVNGSYVSGSFVSDYYSVRFVGSLPADALRPDVDDGVVSEMLEGARLGEPVTCHVRQTYLGAKIAGPQTKITHCWR
jgi:hypothetical protein